MVAVADGDKWLTFHPKNTRVERVRIRYVMPYTHLNLREEDVVRLVLEFLHNRDLHIAQLSLERETGVINGNFSDDMLFLRQLILDGQWDDVLEFIQPLEALPSFNISLFNYTILRHKYIELLCIKSESAADNNVNNAVEEVVKVLNDLQKLAPTKEEYSNLCLLLTLPRLTDHAQFKKWNPSNARVQCFREVYPLVEHFLPCDKKEANSDSVTKSAENDRLVQLIIKGILYEFCVNFCGAKANGSQDSPSGEVNFSQLLDGFPLNESDLSLLCWLQSIPGDTFTVPFTRRTLNVDIERLERPSLETSWTEHMFVTPIKPKTFPHSAMPFTRPRSAADAMTRSLRPLPEGAPHPALANMAQSVGDYHPSVVNSCFAGFHLTGIKSSKLMNSSVDRLFENENFSGNGHAEFARLNPICESGKQSTGNNISPGARGDSPDRKKSQPPSEDSTARSSRRDSLSEKQTSTPSPGSAVPFPQTVTNRTTISAGTAAPTQTSTPSTMPPHNVTSSSVITPETNSSTASPSSSEATTRRDLLREYQMQKQRVLASKVTKDLVQQMNDAKITTDSSLALGPNPLSAPSPALEVENDVEVNGTHASTGKPRTNLTGASNATNNKNTEAHGVHYDAVKPIPRTVMRSPSANRPRFVAVTSLEDVQAVRCAEFHPNGKLYAVGSNSRLLRICSYPNIDNISETHTTYQPTVLFKRTKHHKGSIYCLSWSPAGDLLATGSNDKTVKLMRFNADTSNLEGQEVELTMHDGTVRDMCFIEDSVNRAALLVSGGAGDCKIYVTDCATGTPYQALSGHSALVLALYNWGGAMFVSGSQDKTVRFWDLRTGGCVNIVSPASVPGTRGSPVASLAVDPSGRLLVTGHEDATCALYDVRGARAVQRFQPHGADVRSVRFSPAAYYLLTGGYDGKLVLTDLQGDLTMPLPSVVVASHTDKVISGRWHPQDFSFLSTSADKTATLWAIPPV